MHSTQAARREQEGERKENKKTHVATLGQPGRHGDHDNNIMTFTFTVSQTVKN